MTDFTARFSLFPARDKKSEKSPDSTGSIEISATDVPALIAYLQDTSNMQEDYQGNSVVKLRIAGWAATSKAGLQYVNGKVSPPLAQPAVATAPF